MGRMLRALLVLALFAVAAAEPRKLLQQESQQQQQDEQEIQQLMNQAQQDHDAAVQIKDNSPGWLQGAPLAAEQADVEQSQQDVQEAQQLQLQMQTNGQQLGGAGNPAEVQKMHPWNCGPYPCAGH